MSMMGSRDTARTSEIRMFLRADSAEELVRSQLRLNVQVKGRANFTDITFADGEWYAWFLIDIDKFPEISDIVNGITEKPV